MDAWLNPDPCGCCETAAAPTPVRIDNPPGLSAVAYRVGTFAGFREAMLRTLSREPALAGLTTRESDDPAITLLELWAAVADVLTFYQERIANEAFLRTAVHRDSVLRMARLLDHHLHPGRAATARLAFTVADGKTVRIPIGLKVMSTPGQDEMPQIFETEEAMTADSRLNRLPVLPPPEEDNALARGKSWAFLTADELGWQAARILKPKDKVVLFNVPTTRGRGLLPAPEEKEIQDIRIESSRFRVDWTTPIVHDWPRGAQACVFRQKMKIFGHDAPKIPVVTQEDPNADGILEARWELKEPSWSVSGTELPLDRIYKDLAVGDRLLVAEPRKVSQVVTITRLYEREAVAGENDTSLVGAFGDYRPRGVVTVVEVRESESLSIENLRNVTLYWLSGPSLPLWHARFPETIESGPLYVPATRPEGSSEGETLEIGYTLVGRERKAGPAIRCAELEAGRRVLLEDHNHRPVAAVLTGCHMGDFAGQPFLVLEVASLTDVHLETRTAVLLGNVAAASHGETVKDEILGDGDAAVPFQRFVLRKKPLTCLKSESTLHVLANGEEWKEEESLYGQGPTARVYTARQADDGTTVLQFGDGVTGARLPTGRGNVIATYRQGSGRAGNLRARQLDIPLERPPGLKAVTNPEETAGGVDPETLVDVRTALLSIAPGGPKP